MNIAHTRRMHRFSLVTADQRDKFWHGRLKRPYRLHTFDHGGSGPLIILLHGLGSSSADWNILIPLLRDHFHCVTIDLIGFGNSPKPQWYGYTVEEHVTNIEATLRSLHLNQPFILIGHSLGSLLATRYSSLHPKQVMQLVLLSPPVYAPLDSITSRRARTRTSLYLTAYKFIRTHKRATPQNIQRLARILPTIRSLTADSATWIPFVRSLEQCIEHQTMISDIKNVRVQVSIFYGVFDEVLVPYNIKQLAKLHNTTIHPLRVNHTIGKRYATAVARSLLL